MRIFFVSGSSEEKINTLSPHFFDAICEIRFGRSESIVVFSSLFTPKNLNFLCAPLLNFSWSFRFPKKQKIYSREELKGNMEVDLNLKKITFSTIHHKIPSSQSSFGNIAQLAQKIRFTPYSTQGKQLRKCENSPFWLFQAFISFSSHHFSFIRPQFFFWCNGNSNQATSGDYSERVIYEQKKKLIFAIFSIFYSIIFQQNSLLPIYYTHCGIKMRKA